MDNLETLAEKWKVAKDAETIWKAERHEIEYQILSLISWAENFSGTENAEAPGGWKIKVTGRMNRTVDYNKAKEIAKAHGIECLDELFRIKAEINKKAWEKKSTDITGPLNAAITTTPGRPAFKIKKDNKK